MIVGPATFDERNLQKQKIKSFCDNNLKGWTKFKEEFNEVFRGLTQLGYAVFFIGHDKEVTLTDANGNPERMIIRPALSNATREVIAGMSDIYGYAHQLRKDEMSVLTLRDPSGTYECGCRFKHIPHQITMSYDNLVGAINQAIDAESQEFVTDERVSSPVQTTYDFAALMNEFSEIVGNLMVKDSNVYAPKVTIIVERYLGRGKKASEATPEQAEFIYLILQDIKKELL